MKNAQRLLTIKNEKVCWNILDEAVLVSLAENVKVLAGHEQGHGQPHNVEEREEERKSKKKKKKKKGKFLI